MFAGWPAATEATIRSRLSVVALAGGMRPLLVAQDGFWNHSTTAFPPASATDSASAPFRSWTEMALSEIVTNASPISESATTTSSVAMRDEPRAAPLRAMAGFVECRTSTSGVMSLLPQGQVSGVGDGEG